MNVPGISSFGLKRLVTFAKSNKISIHNIIVICLTFSVEELFQKIVFHCPCHNASDRLIYGGMFLVAPAIILFATGILMNKNCWCLVTGCFYRSNKTTHRCVTCLFELFTILGNALIAPVAWIFMALIDGSYYRCIKSENPCLLGDEINIRIAKEYNQNLVVQSQILGWIFLVSIVIFALLAFTTVRCFSRTTYYQRNFIHLIQEKESDKFEEKSAEIAKLVATENVNLFFKCEHRTKEDWDEICRVTRYPSLKVSSCNQLSIDYGLPYCSSLDKWCKHKEKCSCEVQNTNEVNSKNADSVAENDKTETSEKDELIPPSRTSNGIQ